MKTGLSNLEENKVKKEKNYADKEITTDDSAARREVYQGYYVYLIPKNKAVNFKILALKAINTQATQKNVYWIAQPYNKFKTNKWLNFKVNKETVIQPETLAKHLTALNKYSKKYKDVVYSEKDTRYVGKQYTMATYKKVMGKDTFGSIDYKSNKLGAGIWLEGINYRPGWMSQGAFIIAVQEPQILSFYAKKRETTQEKDIKFISKDIQALETELEYSNIVDVHMALHNVPYYDIELLITVDGKELEKECISLDRNIDNPVLDYNVEQRYELYIKPEWIETLDHEEGKDNQDSIKEGKLSITLVPNRAILHAPYTEEQVKNLKKEITFTINYRDEWAVDEDEQEWIPQIAEIQEATLVTQSYEECGFTAIKITDDYGNFHILKQAEDGSLEINNTTPILEYVAGGNKTPQTITIDLEEVQTAECLQAGFDNTQDSSNTHTNNTFDTTHLPTETVNSELFGSITPVKIVSKTENKLQIKLAYPYKADTYLEVFAKYMFGAKHIPYPVLIKSCRYIRTPIFNIYPDLQWAVHINYAVKKVLFYKAEEVKLIEFNQNLYDYLKPVVEFLYTKVMKPIEELLAAHKYLASSDEDEFKFLSDDLEGLVEKFIESENETIQLGYHHKMNGELINYAEKQPNNYFLYYYAFQLSLMTLALDLVILYFVTGRMKLKSLKKAKNIKQAISKISNKKISFTYPKVSCNFGYEYEQMADGKTALIIRFTLQAKPFLGVSINEELTPEGKLKGKLKASFSLNLAASADINVKYNCLTNTWSLNENASDQIKALYVVKQNKNLKVKGGLGFAPPPPEVKNGEAFIDGDVIRTDLKVKGEAILEGEVAYKYYLIDFEAKAAIDGQISSFIGLERIIGFDNQKGPFTQERIYFSGLQYEVKAEYKVGAFGYYPKFLNDEYESKGNLIEPFDYKTKRMHIMQIFK
ncbi:hypothetical protein ACSTS3_15935 [Aquimarina muelleri]|uniref:hypothetical protein n=1 Tax=Aquimarina muelleri TaxID=279356 RepID=UPI003F68942E